MKKRKLKYAKIFEFPPSVMAGGVNLQIYTNIGCTVENYDGILNYTSELLRLETAVGVVRMEGEDFVIREMDEDTLKVTGRIFSVVYEAYTR